MHPDHRRCSGNEKYIIAINPSGKNVRAELGSMDAVNVKYVFGTSEKCSYKPGKKTDMVRLPAVSAAVFKIE
jgi:hypothetical protein